MEFHTFSVLFLDKRGSNRPQGVWGVGGVACGVEYLERTIHNISNGLVLNFNRVLL